MIIKIWNHLLHPLLLEITSGEKDVSLVIIGIGRLIGFFFSLIIAGIVSYAKVALSFNLAYLLSIIFSNFRTASLTLWGDMVFLAESVSNILSNSFLG